MDGDISGILLILTSGAGLIVLLNVFVRNKRRTDLGDVGFVPGRLLIGRAVRIWMNWQIAKWRRLHRVGKAIE